MPQESAAAIAFMRLFPVILVTLGLLPSAAWLLFYIRRDPHPEPKKMVFKVFVWGMLIAPLAVIAQYLVLSLMDAQGLRQDSVVALLSLAAIEEFLKYLVVLVEIEDEPDFNEPTDAMVYMIAAAMGFAAIENVSIAFSVAPMGIVPGTGANTANVIQASHVIGVRFLGATLLHAFASSIVGYFLAFHVFKLRGWGIIILGLGIATALHAFFNYLILQNETVRVATFLVSALAMVVVIITLFNRLRSMPPTPRA